MALVVDVGHAIQHAHQKGIIHRDVKPSNILVAEYDHHPVPKIIDFGVAKALNSQLTDKTMFTQLGQIVGTIEYMSPEQSRVNQMDVDTRSDIYSLLAGNDAYSPEEIQSLLNTALLGDSFDPVSLRSIGAVFSELGYPEVAKAVFSKAIEMTPPPAAGR